MARYDLQKINELHQKATDEGDLKTLQLCENLYNQIVWQDLENWPAIFMLGSLYMQLGKDGTAIQLLERAKTLAPECGEVYNNLGNAYRSCGHWDEANENYLKCVELQPDKAEAWNNLSTNYVNEGMPEDGEQYARKALQIDPENPQANWNLSLMLLEQGHFREGWPLYRWGKVQKMRRERYYAGAKEWDGSHVKTLVIYGEQGIGDEIMFMSMVPDVLKRCDKLIIDAHPRLVDLFKRAWPEADVYGTRKETLTEWGVNYDIDAKCAVGDLGDIFRQSPKDFPRVSYLTPNEDYQARAKERLEKTGEGPYIGIHWSGGKKKTREDLRSIPLKHWVGVVKAIESIGGTAVSLQYTEEAADDVKEFNIKNGTNIQHWPEYVDAFNYDWAGGLVGALDYVVTVNTSIVHLCGAMGKEALVLTPRKKAWRYWSPNGSDMVWYGDNIELLHNEGEWSKVLEEVERRCKQLAKSTDSKIVSFTNSEKTTGLQEAVGQA